MENEYVLEYWKEMMCAKMQKSLHHCITPDGTMVMGNACKGECRYSHYPLNTDLSKEIFEEWKLKWFDDIPKCRDFNCCHELMSCGINILCGDCTIYDTWKNRIMDAYVCKTVYCMDCMEKYTCKDVRFEKDHDNFNRGR